MKTKLSHDLTIIYSIYMMTALLLITVILSKADQEAAQPCHTTSIKSSKTNPL